MPSDKVLPGRLAWICGTCQGAIITGVVHVSLSEVREAERSHKDHERNRSTDGEDFNTFTEMFSGPRIARWAATCDGCRSDAGHNCATCYAIDIEQIQSVFALWKWTRQLHGKNWFEVSNWIEFACNVADRTAPAHEAAGAPHPAPPRGDQHEHHGDHPAGHHPTLRALLGTSRRRLGALPGRADRGRDQGCRP